MADACTFPTTPRNHEYAQLSPQPTFTHSLALGHRGGKKRLFV
jgi:hypothetical protein